MKAILILLIALLQPALAAEETPKETDRPSEEVQEEAICVQLADYSHIVAKNRDRGVTAAAMVDAVLNANQADLATDVLMASAIYTVYVYYDMPVNEVSFKILAQCQELMRHA